MGKIRDEVKERLALAERGEAIDKQLENRNERPGATDTQNDRCLRVAKAADGGQLRTMDRLLRGSRLFAPTETTADAIE